MEHIQLFVELLHNNWSFPMLALNLATIQSGTDRVHVLRKMNIFLEEWISLASPYLFSAILFNKDQRNNTWKTPKNNLHVLGCVPW